MTNEESILEKRSLRVELIQEQIIECECAKEMAVLKTKLSMAKALEQKSREALDRLDIEAAETAGEDQAASIAQAMDEFIEARDVVWLGKPSSYLLKVGKVPAMYQDKAMIHEFPAPIPHHRPVFMPEFSGGFNKERFPAPLYSRAYEAYERKWRISAGFVDRSFVSPQIAEQQIPQMLHFSLLSILYITFLYIIVYELTKAAEVLGFFFVRSSK